MSDFTERPRGWNAYPLTISRIQREAIDKTARRGPRPDELALFKRIEAEAIRERRRQNAAAITDEVYAPAKVIKYLNAVQQVSA